MAHAHRPQLDSLRAFAIFAVLVSHFAPSAYPREYLEPGYLGVRLFFVLSGYLITEILLRCREAVENGECSTALALRQFYVRRALRIFPAYYCLLGAAWLVNPANIRDTFWWHAAYASNILFAVKGKWEPWVAAHFWTLAVEEQFYLIWPLLILFVSRRYLPFLISAIVMSGPVYRFLVVQAGGGMPLYIVTFSSFDALGTGALLALAGTHSLRQRALRVVGPLALAVCVLVPLLGVGVLGVYELPLVEQVVMPVVFVLPMVWIVGLAAQGISGPVGWLLSRSSLIYIGRISYGIYLYHLFVLWLFRGLGHETGFAWPGGAYGQFAGLALVTIAVASMSWHLLEKPLNGLKHRFSVYPERCFAPRLASRHPRRRVICDLACGGSCARRDIDGDDGREGLGGAGRGRATARPGSGRPRLSRHSWRAEDCTAKRAGEAPSPHRVPRYYPGQEGCCSPIVPRRDRAVAGARIMEAGARWRDGTQRSCLPRGRS